MQGLLLIRVDAGPQGWGHVMRCLALAEEWSFRGRPVQVLLGNESESPLLTERFRSLQIVPEYFERHSPQADWELVNRRVAELQPAWLVLDGYALDAEYQANLRLRATHLAAFSDSDDSLSPYPQVVINGNLSAKSDRPQDAFVLEGTKEGGVRVRQRVLAGPRFLALRREFQGSVAERVSRHPSGGKLLVLLGGRPSDDLIRGTLRGIEVATEKSGWDWKQIDLVAGGQAGEGAGKSKWSSPPLSCPVTLWRNVHNLRPFYEEADLAISAAGSTLYELSRMGVPWLAFSVAENQKPGLKAFVSRNLGWQTLNPELDHGESLAAALMEIAGCAGREFDDRSHRLRAVVDGQGVQRIASVLEHMPVTLRPAIAEDLWPLLALRNDPEVRVQSLQQDEVPAEVHRDWFERKRNDARCRLLVATTQEGKVVGQVRFDLSPERGEALISISLGPALRGLGMSGPLLCGALQCFSHEKMGRRVLAQIREDNVASLKAFAAAGFQTLGKEMISGVPCVQMAADI